MAHAKTTYETRTVEKTVTVEERVPTVTLELSKDEAETLAAIFAKVAGSPYGSPRNHVNAMATALREVGVRHWSSDGHPYGLIGDSSVIVFRDYDAQGGEN